MSILVQNIDVVHKMVEAVTIKFRLYYKQKEIETIFPRPQTVSVAAVGREEGQENFIIYSSWSNWNLFNYPIFTFCTIDSAHSLEYYDIR